MNALCAIKLSTLQRRCNAIARRIKNALPRPYEAHSAIEPPLFLAL